MIAFLFFLVFLLVYMVFAVYAERKISAFIQDRLGPTEIGPYGAFQTLADLVKLLQKEDIVPEKADKWVFMAAPAVIFTAIFAGFAVMPVTPTLQGSGVAVGVFYLLTIISVDIVGLMAAGWSSNNKYSLLGAMRSVAQIVSYEIPVGLSVLCVVVFCQTLDLQEICYQQGIYANSFSSENEPVKYYLFESQNLGIDITNMGGFLQWNVIRMPLFFLVYVIFFIATLAEANRAPFDIPEAESELVGGFHTEYSGFRWALLFLAEYGMMLLVSFLGAVLFFGGWNTPFPNMGSVRLADWTSGLPGTGYGTVTGAFWIILKALVGVFLQMWVRWTYPRLRVDQLMHLCWKVLTPASLLLLFLSALWKLIL